MAEAEIDNKVCNMHLVLNYQEYKILHYGCFSKGMYVHTLRLS